MEQISISQIQRNLHKLDEFDIVEVIDKKRDKIKGYFIDSKYISFIQELEEKIKCKKTKSLGGVLNKYANPDKIDRESTVWKEHIMEKYKK